MSAKINEKLTEDPHALVTVAQSLVSSGQVAMAEAIVKQAMLDKPEDHRIRAVASLVFTSGVPKYHFSMLSDEPRNRAYQEAIERAAPSARRVLDLGTGSGLLAMMAARAGADEVVACEAHPLIAATAAENVRRNGLGHRVRIVPKTSFDLVEDDVGGSFDLLVTETFGNDLIGEGVLKALPDVLDRLGSPNVRVIPARGQVMIALAEFACRRNSVESVSGFDLSEFNRHARWRSKIDGHDMSIRLKSDPVAIFDFDLTARSHPTDSTVKIVSHGGRVDGLIQWLRLDLDEHSTVDAAPDPHSRSHWGCICWPLEAPAESEPGSLFPVQAWRHDGYLHMWVTEVPSRG